MTVKVKTVIIVCTTCPIGCEMTVEHEGRELISVAGHTCKRGEAYAENEILNPRRVLTSTVILNGGSIKLMPVKTTKPIRKDRLFDGMRIINSIKINAPIKMGDIVYENFTESDINLVAGRDVEIRGTEVNL